jgi:hypothetical protein
VIRYDELNRHFKLNEIGAVLMLWYTVMLVLKMYCDAWDMLWSTNIKLGLNHPLKPGATIYKGADKYDEPNDTLTPIEPYLDVTVTDCDDDAC